MADIENSNNNNFVFQIDYLRIKNGRVYGWGWLFHKSKTVVSLSLVIRGENVNLQVPSEFGIPRPDVASDYAYANASNSGFIVAGKVPEGINLEVFLDVQLKDGSSGWFDITACVVKDSARVHAKGWTTIRWTKATVKYLAAGDLKGWLRQVKYVLRERISRRGLIYPLDSDMIAKMSRLSEQVGLFLVIDHNLGGGANLYRQRLVEEMRRDGIPVLLLYYHLPELEYRGQYIWQNQQQSFIISLESFMSLASRLKIQEIFLNNVFSFDDPIFFATLLLRVKQISNAPLTVAIHDFFLVCPSYNLLNEEYEFCGIPQTERCQHCLQENKGTFKLLVDCNDIATWRHTWDNVLHSATTILCFSKCSRDLLCRAYPDLDQSKIVVRPHRIDCFCKHKPQLDFRSPLNIGVVGTISVHKGAAIVEQMVGLIEKQLLPVHITVIGEMDRPVRSAAITITGRYELDKLPRIIESRRVNVFFLPSVCPETFCYVAEELMMLGVPLAVFDLGAQAERVAKYPMGLVISQINAETALNELIQFYTKLRERCGTTSMSQERDAVGETNP